MELAVDIVVAALLVLGLALVVRDTARRSGRWGINLRPLACPKCGSKRGGVVRAPHSVEQAAWGGRTCGDCGCRMDKWGRQVAG
ncbi:MAG: hypothetical protein ACM31C_28180 [Acidobacteriota bacterium]